ncbi:hypothetical protein GOB57_24635 [Sinorhizobium meliloti]|nr:hypothetical protein [Sinorhizobium meliloti]
MFLAENDNTPTLVLVTSEETVARFRALRTRLDVESDAELLDLALESREHVTLSGPAHSRPMKMNSNLTLSLPRETLASLAAERMRTGMSYEETIRKALCALAAVAGSGPPRGTELAS